MSNETILVNQFNTACLSQYSYYIEINKEAAIIDPVTDYQPYLQILSSNQAKLKFVLNTHINSDYISGSIDLAARTGATLIYGPNASFYINRKLVNSSTMDEELKEFLLNFNIKIRFLEHREKIKLGKIEIELLHTPGHTIESSCFVVIDGNGKSNSAFTGDTLLIGDIGKPDVAIMNTKRDNIYQKDLAIMLYNSLNYLKEIIPGNLVLYPAHSFGYPIAKNLVAGQSTTIETEKKQNKFFGDVSQEEFLELLSEDKVVFPYHYNHISNLNINYQTGNNFEYNLIKQFKPINLENFIKGMDSKQFILLDSRNPFTEVDDGIIPGSTLISLKAPFSIWAGFLLNPDDPIVVIAHDSKEKEAISRLLRIGFRNINGYLEGGFAAYFSKYEEILMKLGLEEKKSQFQPIKLKIIKNQDCINHVYNTRYRILDVRESVEHSAGAFPNSICISLTELKKSCKLLSKDENMYLLCKTGVRASMAYSILLKEGFNSENLFLLEGGLTKLKEKGIKI